MLVDALSRACTIREHGMGLAAVAVDSKTEHVASFYERVGFIRFADDTPPRLFIPIKTACEAVHGLLPGETPPRAGP